MKNLDVSSLYNDEKKRFLQVDKSDFIFKFIVLFTVYLKTICAAIKRSCAASAITLVKDNTRASIIYSISLVNISCLLFSHRSFCIISCIYIMASEVKYKKKGGGNSCAINSCSNNRRKLNEWKQIFCELHKQKHEDCSCMIPYRLHMMPSKESIRLQ